MFEKNKIISKFLIDKYNLWLWDFDDTLIDTYTYYIKNMEPEYILNRTVQDLDEDLPCWKYFKLKDIFTPNLSADNSRTCNICVN